LVSNLEVNRRNAKALLGAPAAVELDEVDGASQGIEVP